MFIHTKFVLIINYLRDVVIIKLMDYLASSMDVPEISTETSGISVISNNIIQINNFVSIEEYDDNKISINTKTNNIVVIGYDFSIKLINEKFIQIEGTIKSISFEGCD